MRVGVAADQSGLVLKDSVLDWLREQKHLTVDYGAHPDCPADDFLHHALAMAWAVSRGTVERGILFSESGIGGAIVANKIRGVRAGFTHDPESLRHATAYNHMNVFSLWSAGLELGGAIDLLRVFLSCPYVDDAATRRRLARIAALVNRFSFA